MNRKKSPPINQCKIAISLLFVALLTFINSASAYITITGSSAQGAAPLTPPWSAASSHLLSNVMPTTASGNFTTPFGAPGTAAGVIVLTTNGNSLQGRSYPGEGNVVFCGGGSGSGTLLEYTLTNTPATFGYNITNISVYSSWQDGGRDRQDYTVYYSTVSAPTTFIYLTSVRYDNGGNPSNPTASCNRVVIQDSSAGAPIVGNVYALRFDFTFPGAENGAAGYNAITVEGTAAAGANVPVPAVAFTGTIQSGANPYTPTYTLETPNLISGLAPTTATGNFADGVGGTATLTDNAIGISGTGSGFASCGNNDGNTLIYTLTNSANGSDLTNIVVYSGWGDAGRYGQYYDLSYSTVSQPSTYVPIRTIYYLPGTSGAPSARVAIFNATNGAFAKNVLNLKFAFNAAGAGSFNNGWQGYSEIVVQGTNSAPPAVGPSPFLTQDTLPTYVETVVGDTVVFSAAYSNTPPAALQWVVVKAGVTNPVPGATTATLTLNNVQTTDSGTYLLRGTNTADGTALPAYSTGAPLAVSNTPAAVNNVIMLFTSQNGGTVITNFFPTWTVDTSNDLILGFPTDGTGNPNTATAGAGDFGKWQVNGDPTILADGTSGYLNYWPGVGASPTLVSCGLDGSGSTMTYFLDTSSAIHGFDLTNIVVYGGWGDDGRNQQLYEVLYSSVATPNAYISMGRFSYNPHGLSGVPSATRTTLIPASGQLARGVKNIKINWNLQNPPVKNSTAGYSEVIVQGAPSPAVVTLSQDINPATAEDVVGSSLTLTASFNDATSYQWEKNGTNLVGATSPTLTLSPLQLSDTATNGGYRLVASNLAGPVASSACTVTVKPVPAAVHNVVVAWAVQTVSSFVGPTWDTSLLGASLIAGAFPSSFDTNNFNDPHPATPRNHNTAGGLPILTDNNYGVFSDVDDMAFATCGPGVVESNGEKSGGWAIYTLPVAVNGYDITNMIIAGGWNDIGRECQQYTVLYSTVANPTLFIPLIAVSNNPALNAKTTVRGTYTPATGARLAGNVAAVYMDWLNPPGVPNAWSGYSQISLFGSPSATPFVPPTSPTAGAPVVSGGDLIVTGSGGTANYPYSWLSTTDLTTPLTNWTVSATGFLDGAGAYSNAIPISASEPARFFQLRMP